MLNVRRMTTNSGAHYEIAIGGTPRTYRDQPDLAKAAAEQLKWNNRNSEVAVRDMRTNERTVIQLPKSPSSPAVKMRDPGEFDFRR